jgi:hypothetical protein
MRARQSVSHGCEVLELAKTLTGRGLPFEDTLKAPDAVHSAGRCVLAAGNRAAWLGTERSSSRTRGKVWMAAVLAPKLVEQGPSSCHFGQAFGVVFERFRQGAGLAGRVGQLDAHSLQALVKARQCLAPRKAGDDFPEAVQELTLPGDGFVGLGGRCPVLRRPGERQLFLG